MKRAITMLLALMLIFGLCACGSNENEKKLAVSAKELAAATLKSADYTAIDKLADKSDEDFAKRFFYFYGLEDTQVSDYALASCTDTKSDEISILVAAEGVDMEALTSALNDRCIMQKASYELYSPEDVAKLEKAEVFSVGNCAVMIVADDAGALKNVLLGLFDAPDTVPALAEEFISGLQETVVDTYDYSSPVPESTPKDDTWFSDAVFVGDSRMVGLVQYAEINCAANFSHESLNIADMFTKEYISTASGSKTIADALQGGSYGKCYIMTGVNELGWQNFDIFIEYYGDFIDHIKQTHPETQIYVMSILPVGTKATENQSYFNNDRVNNVNSMIQKMCGEKGVYYVNVFDAVAVNGSLPDDAAPDGVHMNGSYCNAVKQYLLSHTVETVE